jgi:hypothetical protein
MYYSNDTPIAIRPQSHTTGGIFLFGSAEQQTAESKVHDRTVNLLKPVRLRCDDVKNF